MKSLMKYVPLALLSAFFLLSFGSSLRESVTVDEFYHLPAGYSYLKTGTFALANNTPPLATALAATPLLIRNAEFPRTPALDEKNHWDYAYDFMFAHSHDYIRLFRDARLVILLIGVLGGWFVFLWSREMYGFHAACLALFLYALSPNLLAHSHYVTSDVPVSTFLIAALYFIYRWTVRRTWREAVAAGVMLGLLQLTKFTALILYPVLMGYFVLLVLKPQDVSVRDGWKMAAILLLSLLVLNAGYLFHGSFAPLKDFQFTSALLRGVSSELPGWVRVPFPSDYVMGLDLQLKDTQGVFFQFLMGKASTEGWWYYYLVAFIFKVPVMLLALLVVCAVLQCCRKLPAISFWEYPILLTIFFYSLMMIFGRLNLGFRYALPLIPLCHVWVSRVMLLKPGSGIRKLALLLVLMFYAAESLSVFPHFLSFFNLLAGTPTRGHRILADSNIDWGQDLPALKEYMDQHQIDSIDLAYFGRVDPAIYGIRYRPLKKGVRGKPVAVSMNYYQGLPYYLPTESREYMDFMPPFYYNYLKQYPIKARIGYSLLIIEIP